jgi:hypothetical protein
MSFNGDSSPSLGHDVFCECELLMVHSCILLVPNNVIICLHFLVCVI